jgi:ABC-2 type transport system permease protein
MFANVLTKTLHDQRRGLLGWSIGVALTVLLMGGIWPSFSDMDINALLDQYPEAMKQLFNVTDMGTGSGYLNAELFSLMLPAMFVIFAVARGARLVAGEEEDGTLDVLATLPVSRRLVLLQKAGALALEVGGMALVLFVSTCVASLAFDLRIPVLHAANGALSMFLLGLEFGLVALAIGAGTGRRSVAVGASAGIAGGTYLLFLMAQLVEGVRPLRVLSPIYQATTEGPIGPDVPPVAGLMLVTGIVVLAASIPRFDRRDLGV